MLNSGNTNPTESFYTETLEKPQQVSSPESEVGKTAEKPLSVPQPPQEESETVTSIVTHETEGAEPSFLVNKTEKSSEKEDVEPGDPLSEKADDEEEDYIEGVENMKAQVDQTAHDK